MQTRVDVLSDIPEKIDFLVDFDEYDVNMYVHQKMKVDFNVAKQALKVAFDALSTLDDWSEEAIKETMKASAEANGLKGGQVMFSVRVALTGQPSTPGGAVEMAVVLGKEESMRRLQFSIDYLDRVVG
jgi:glutamyl-tRNA synthetase